MFIPELYISLPVSSYTCDCGQKVGGCSKPGTVKQHVKVANSQPLLFERIQNLTLKAHENANRVTIFRKKVRNLVGSIADKMRPTNLLNATA